MFRITNRSKSGEYGTWRVMDGDHYQIVPGDNPNLFFTTLAAARRKVKELNR